MKGKYLEIETERLILKPFKSLTEEQKEELIKSWDNPFNARYNAEPDSRKSVEDIIARDEPTFTLIGESLESYYDTMFFRVAYDKVTGELIGSCRFGKYPGSKTMDMWDFGFNVLVRHWSKSYGTEMVKKIIEIAKLEDAKYFRGGADNDNFASYHAMAMNGFKRCEKPDDDGDFEYILDLNAPKPTKEEMEQEWANHIKAYIERPSENGLVFGQEKFDDLQVVSKLTKEMVEKIQSGGDEDALVEEYNNKVEEILAKHTTKNTCEND